MVEIVLAARDESIAAAVKACAERRISFGLLCEAVARMGYKTTSLHEMVRAAEAIPAPPFSRDPPAWW